MPSSSRRISVPAGAAARRLFLLAAAAALPAQADWRTDLVLPKARAVHTAAYDVANNQIVLFGGNTNAGVQGDTWLWTATGGWTQARPAQAPTARREHAMAYDLARGEVVLFGGWDGAHQNDTWLWNNGSWRLATPASSPSPRMPELAFDPVSARVLMFGGEDAAGGRLSETWSWDGSTWTQLLPATTPPARFDHALATDWTRNQVLLFGGWNNGFLGDTWIWNGSNWLPGPAAGPPARSEHRLASVGSDVVLFGGDSTGGRRQDTWSFDGSSWTQRSPAQSPPLREEHVLVADLARGAAMLFGGWHSASGHLADQWTFASGQWTADTAVQPTGAGTAAMAYDPVAARSLLFGGYQDEQVSNQTWQYGNGAWSRLTPATSPPARAEPALAFDRARGEFVLFGGVDGTTYYNDTWVFRAGNWQQRLPATSPPARWGHAMVFDEARGTVLLHSGRLGGSGSNLTDTWEWNGSSWTQLLPATTPRGREDHGLVFDLGRGEPLMFGGYIGGSGFSNETWVFRGGNWLLLQPANLPSARSEQMLAYDRARGRVVMFGGQDQSGRVADTWEFVGGDWLQRAPTQAPAPREEGVMVFDEQLGEIVLALGWDLGHFTDTWTFGARPAATADAYGAGCQGAAAATPVLGADRPWLGGQLLLRATALPAGAAALLAFGFARSNLALDPFGMPGCALLVQSSANVLVVASGSSASLAMPLPAVPGLVGVAVDAQALVLAPGANAAGLVASNGVELRLALP